MMSVNRFIATSIVPRVPERVLWFFARSYIAGETLNDALRVASQYNESGIETTTDVLGEATKTAEQAQTTVAQYLGAIPRLSTDVRRANVSVKLTALGLDVDRGQCERNLRTLCAAARDHGVFVRIDMESSAYTGVTLAIYERLRSEFPAVGITLQAMLKRTPADARRMAAIKANVRLCKGIYIEPPAIAFQTRSEIHASYLATLETLLDGGCYVGLATHHGALIAQAEALIGARRLSRGEYEFQMLHGVTGQAARLVAQGHRLRVYLPFGAQWRRYAERRLHENPRLIGAMAHTVVGDGAAFAARLVGRVAPRSTPHAPRITSPRDQ